MSFDPTLDGYQEMINGYEGYPIFDNQGQNNLSYQPVIIHKLITLHRYYVDGTEVSRDEYKAARDAAAEAME